MTILQSLAAFYGRLHARDDAPAYGWEMVRMAWAIPLEPDGTPNTPRRLGDAEASPPGALFEAPAAVKRTSGLRSNLFWDKPAYVLGLKAVDRPEPTRDETPEEHSVFRRLHLELLADEDDAGLTALRRFVESWTANRFEDLNWPSDMLAGDRNITFFFDRTAIFRRANARRLVGARNRPDGDLAFCLATGKRAPVARLHPGIKGVVGAQTSGASLVSFNLSAFESFGHAQGANAPVSSQAAFAYGTALNWLLGKGNSTPRRLRFAHGHTPTRDGFQSHFRTADATVVFWAEGNGSDPDQERAAQAAEDLTHYLIGDDPDVDEEYATGVLAALNELRGGRADAWERLDLHGAADIRLHVLGLSPNNARLAPRFWHVDRAQAIVDNVLDHQEDLRIEPSGFRRPPSLGALLLETAVGREFKNVPPRLSGELAKSVLTGGRYPRTLLTAVIGRVRADKTVSGARAAIIKAVINRDIRKRNADEPVERMIPVGLDPQNDNAAYQLGRLFALIEGAQKAALPGLNATVKDRFFGAACATPARVFPLLMKNTVNHLAVVRKSGKAPLSGWFEREIGAIWARLSDELPRALRLEDQGRFIAGYYHQRFDRKNDAPSDANAVLQQDPDPSEEDAA